MSLTEHEKNIIIASIQDALIDGLADWWDIIRTGITPVQDGNMTIEDKEKFDAWYSLVRSSFVPLIQGADDTTFTKQEFADLVNAKWTLRFGEIMAIKKLLEVCDENNQFTENVQECREYGY